MGVNVCQQRLEENGELTGMDDGDEILGESYVGLAPNSIVEGFDEIWVFFENFSLNHTNDDVVRIYFDKSHLTYSEKDARQDASSNNDNTVHCG